MLQFAYNTFTYFSSFDSFSFMFFVAVIADKNSASIFILRITTTTCFQQNEYNHKNYKYIWTYANLTFQVNTFWIDRINVFYTKIFSFLFNWLYLTLFSLRFVCFFFQLFIIFFNAFFLFCFLLVRKFIYFNNHFVLYIYIFGFCKRRVFVLITILCEWKFQKAKTLNSIVCLKQIKYEFISLSKYFLYFVSVHNTITCAVRWITDKQEYSEE